MWSSISIPRTFPAAARARPAASATAMRRCDESTRSSSASARTPSSPMSRSSANTVSNIPLIADPDRRLADLYDVNSILPLIRPRITYVIDKQGFIERAMRHDLLIGRHLSEVREALQSLAAGLIRDIAGEVLPGQRRNAWPRGMSAYLYLHVLGEEADHVGVGDLPPRSNVTMPVSLSTQPVGIDKEAVLVAGDAVADAGGHQVLQSRASRPSSCPAGSRATQRGHLPCQKAVSARLKSLAVKSCCWAAVSIPGCRPAGGRRSLASCPGFAA